MHPRSLADLLSGRVWWTERVVAWLGWVREQSTAQPHYTRKPKKKKKKKTRKVAIVSLRFIVKLHCIDVDNACNSPTYRNRETKTLPASMTTLRHGFPLHALSDRPIGIVPTIVLWHSQVTYMHARMPTDFCLPLVFAVSST